jgi:ketosteroid isomerase-like protein
MKIRLLPALAGLAIGFAVAVFAQEKDTVDPEVRQQIEALVIKFDEAYNRSDAAAIADLFTLDAVQVWEWESAGGVASDQQAIEKRYAAQLASSPGKLVRKLVQLYPIGDEVCAISAFTHPQSPGKPGYCVTIFVRELDDWKVRTEYWK